MKNETINLYNVVYFSKEQKISKKNKKNLYIIVSNIIRI